MFGVKPNDLLDMTPSEINALWAYVDALNKDK